MNKNTLAVLKVINQYSKDGEAVILEKDELTAGITGESAGLNEIIKELTLTEHIKLKYQDGDTYCLITLPKGKLLAENDANTNKKGVDPSAINIKIDYKRLSKICFMSAFLGGLLAGAIMVVLFVIFLL